MRIKLLGRYISFCVCLIFLTNCGGPRAVLWHGKNATPATVAAQNAAINKPGQPKAVVPVYVATSRQAQNDYSEPFGTKRSKNLNYARVDVGIPQEHKKGLVETNGYKPDLKKYFSAVNMVKYNGREEFKKELNKALDQKPKGKREIFLFIHGYNNNFADSTFRAAQFSYDYSLKAVTVHYSWPSGGSIPLYVYDRDSADFARDGLADLLTLLSETDANEITVVAHSMGNYVTMEALRSLALQGKRHPIDRISSFLMAAPDIDIDVFERQLKDVKKMPQPTAVLVSRKDKALAVSGRLVGGHARVGDGSSIPLLQKNGIAVLDLSDVDGGAHNVFASSPTLMALAHDGSLSTSMMKETSETNGQRMMDDSGNILRGTTNLIFYTPARIISAVSQN